MEIENVVGAEELAAEQEALKAPKDEEIRASLIEEFGFDETTDADRIDRLVEKQKKQFEITSKAIKQKIKHRNDANDLRKKIPADIKAPVAENKSPDVTFKDSMALIEAKVPQDDVDDVVEYAKFKGISVSEALKSSVVKNTLAEKAEQRASAAAANVGPTRRVGSTQPKPGDLIDKARRGEEVDADSLAEARMAKRRESLQK